MCEYGHDCKEGSLFVLDISVGDYSTTVHIFAKSLLDAIANEYYDLENDPTWYSWYDDRGKLLLSEEIPTDIDVLNDVGISVNIEWTRNKSGAKDWIAFAEEEGFDPETGLIEIEAL